MESKVVHMRIDLSTLIGCYDATIAAGAKIEGESTASIVSTTLKAGIKSMRAAGFIPNYPSEELLLIRARELLGEGEKVDVELDWTDRGLELEGIKDTPTLDEMLEQATREVLEKTEHPFPTEEEVISSSVNSSREDMVYLEKEQIMEIAPKDRLVEACGDDEDKWFALGVVYHQLREREWGSDVAERLWKQTLEIIKR